MTRIVVDPTELLAASETLRVCSVEAAEIGSTLAQCVQCPVPAQIRGTLDAMVSTVDSLLDSIAMIFHRQAVDLAGRALIAAQDSLAAATGTPAPLAIGAGGGMGMIGGYGVGGNVTVGGVGVGMGMIGGYGVGGNVTVGGVGVGAGMIGGVQVLNSGLATGPDTLMIAGLIQGRGEKETAALAAIANNPSSSPADVAAALSAQTNAGNLARPTLSPGRPDIADAVGGYPITGTDTAILAPYTLPPGLRPPGMREPHPFTGI